MTNVDNFSNSNVEVSEPTNERSFGRFEFSSLETVRNRLINLTRNNRLINFHSSRAVLLADKSLNQMVQRFSGAKEYTVQFFPRLTYAQFQAYLDWLLADNQRVACYQVQVQNGKLVLAQASADNEQKTTAFNESLIASLKAQVADKRDQKEKTHQVVAQVLAQQEQSDSLVTHNNYALSEVDDDLEDFMPWDSIELEDEEQVSHALQEQAQLQKQFAANELKPEQLIPLFLTNPQARAAYFASKDDKALISETLEKSINLASYAQYALQLDSVTLGLEQSANPNVNLAKYDSRVQVLGWEQKAGKQVYNFCRNNQKSIKEIGAGIVFLSVGMLEYIDIDNTSCFAPLYLIPVTLKERNATKGNAVYSMVYTGEEIIENVSLAEKLRTDFKVYLPKINRKEDLLLEKKKLKLQVPTSYTEQSIAEELASLENDASYSFLEYVQRVQQSLAEQNYEFALHEQAYLATYQFAKQRMYLDLDPEEWPVHASLDQHPLINELFNEKTGDKEYAVGEIDQEYNIDEIEHIHDLYPILAEADSSQHSALIDVVQGKNLVIEGPPGTGKSQTITNMIAALMKQGKKVLFIAEKMAAQEGVLRRLQDLGLGDFCLDLHDTHSSKKDVFTSIAQRIETLNKFNYPENLPNAIAQYELHKNTLNSYAQEINKPFNQTGFTQQEILAAAGYYKQFSFANGGLGLFDEQVTKDEQATTAFFTKTNYQNIITELDSFTNIIAGLKESLVRQSRYLANTQQHTDPVMALLERADQTSQYDSASAINLGQNQSFKLGGKASSTQMSLSAQELENLRIRDHLWYGISSKELNSLNSSDITQALFVWQKSLVEIKNFLQTLLRTHQVPQDDVVGPNGDLLARGSSSADLELAHLDLLALDVFAQKFAQLPLAAISEYLDFTLLQELLTNPLASDSAFAQLQTDLEHLERYLSFNAAQSQGLFNYAYLECVVMAASQQEQELDYSKVTSIPELRTKHYSLRDRQQILSNPHIGKLFAYLAKQVKLCSQYIANLGQISQLQKVNNALEVYLKRDVENQRTANDFMSRLTARLAGTLELNYSQLVKLAQLLSELPPNLVKYRHINYLSPLMETNFSELKESLNQLNYEIAALQMDYDLAHLSSYEEFVAMRQSLINKPNFIMRMFSSEYKNAKRRLSLVTRGISYDDITTERILARIDSYYAKLRQLQHASTFKEFFGSLYNGSETKLEHIDILRQWTNKVVDFCRNELNNSQLSPVIAYLLSEEEFFGVVETGQIIADDFNRLHQAAQEVNSYLSSSILDYNQLAVIAQQLHPACQTILKLVNIDFNPTDLITLFQDGLALFHEPQYASSSAYTYQSPYLPESVIEQLASYDLSLGDLHGIAVDQEAQSEVKQRLTQERPLGFVAANTWYIAQQLLGLSRLLGDLKASNMQAIAGNRQQMDDLETQLQVGLSLKEVLRTARSQQKQAILAPIELNITSRGILNMFIAFNGIAEFVKAQDKMASLSNSIKNARQAFAAFVQLTDLQEKLWIGQSTNSLIDLIVRNQLALDCADGLVEWLDYLNATQDLDRLGIRKIAHYAEQVPNLGDHQLADMFSQIFFNFLAWKVIETSPILRDFSSINHNAIIEKFIRADVELMYAQRQSTAHAIDMNTRPLPGNEAKRPAELTEMALLNYIAKHPNSRASIRDIIFRAGNSLQALKPCFMMSPASVAQFLTPGSIAFDVMIMDEASQVTPEYALGAIARTKQVVIVGDPKQLPPTNFFQRSNEEASANPEEMLVTESAKSILDVATTMFPTRVLRWHYRSKHESLIAFSNQQFYGSKLVAFPSPYAHHPDYGVKFTPVAGNFTSKSGNLTEAKAVAQAMINHLITHESESLGAVGMNQRQASLIEREFNKLLATNPQAQAVYEKWETTVEPVFVKNLENVQGDERDVIIISCTYGPTKATNKMLENHAQGLAYLGDNLLPQRFGPINMAGGSKRLNVLFTRSKKRMEIYSSFGYEDVKDKSDTVDSGVNDLRIFLKYAQTGILDNPQATAAHKVDSTPNYITRSLGYALSDTYQVESNVGVANYHLDLAFRLPQGERYLLGLETDGVTYAAAKSARDRDRLRTLVLKRLGWNVERLWTVDWFKYSQQEITDDVRHMLLRLAQNNQQ
ncbi:AAA domain-containing protein [Psittacicella hinzii]|uniref:DUF4011 domain-containing protein n=1 Tax=Psittacicella hinzii TaxID=2028575 RepID=A0A3A1YTR3_9GAMM|nr:DUF4011 domain-containing protein [Psittacicella hinzii]RIY40629.1 hypothetical protein CKF58_00190 [Psittacicella hinzii]